MEVALPYLIEQWPNCLHEALPFRGDQHADDGHDVQLMQPGARPASLVVHQDERMGLACIGQRGGFARAQIREARTCFSGDNLYLTSFHRRFDLCCARQVAANQYFVTHCLGNGDLTENLSKYVEPAGFRESDYQAGIL